MEVETEEGFMEAFVPVRPGQTDTPRAVVVLIPMERITQIGDREMAAVIQISWEMAAIGGIGAVLACIVLAFLARGIAGPMNRIIHKLNEGAFRWKRRRIRFPRPVNRRPAERLNRPLRWRKPLPPWRRWPP
jgi:hypothetical protein